MSACPSPILFSPYRSVSVAVGLILAGFLSGLVAVDAKPLALEHAVVLIHGVRNDASVWESKGYLDQLKSTPRFYAAGEISLDRETQFCVQDAEPGIPVFGLSLSQHGQVDIRESGRDLGSVLADLRQRFQIGSFWLVCKSLGGVVAREYVTSDRYANDVERLVTISSPHLGSELAYLPDLHRQLKVCSAHCVAHGEQEPKGWMQEVEYYLAGELGELGLGTAAQVNKLVAKAGWDLEAPALSMLVPPEGDNYIAELNRRPHPKDIEFTSVIAAKHVGNYNLRDLKRDWSRLREGQLRMMHLVPVINDLCRASLTLCSEGTEVHSDLMAGDGAVSVWSQDLNNVDAFAREPRLSASVIRLEAGHHQVHGVLDLPTLLPPREHEIGPGE